MSAFLKTLQSYLKTEWHDNPRLQLATMLALAIFVLYLSLLLSDQQSALESQNKTLAQELEQLKTVADQDYWQQREQDTQKHYTELLKNLWQTTSRGLAQATIDNWLDEQIKSIHLTVKNKRVELAEEVENHSELWQVKAELQGDYEAATFNELLTVIESHPEKIVIDSLIVTKMNLKYFTVQLSAYFQKPPGAAE